MTQKPSFNLNETVEFYHVSNNASFFESFLNEGIKSIGHGVGGQTSGFYVWTNKEAADHHIQFKNQVGETGRDGVFKTQSDFEKDGGLVIGLRLPLSEIKYPDWQIDYEGVNFSNLFSKYASDISKIKNIPFQTKESDSKLFVFSVRTEDAKILYTLETERQNGSNRKEVSNFSYNNIDVEKTGVVQAICDYLCQTNPNFLNDYNQALKKLSFSKKRAALKYTGTKPIKPFYIAKIQPTDETKWEEKVLYSENQATSPSPALSLKKMKNDSSR